METELKNTEEIPVTQENGKRKRTMSEKQLKALEEGRKRRWMSRKRKKSSLQILLRKIPIQQNKIRLRQIK